ncbi:hypothetical protein Hanom_Chr09g00813981 [Helianthus anomalus]
MYYHWLMSMETCSIAKYKIVNYKFCPLCLHQIAGVVLLAKSLQAVSLIFQNLARFVL